jgi:hypothetical protein
VVVVVLDPVVVPLPPFGRTLRQAAIAEAELFEEEPVVVTP